MSNYLKRILEEKHISQNELARRLLLNKSTVSHYISGRIKLKNLSLERISDIAFVLDIPLEEMIGEILKEGK